MIIAPIICGALAAGMLISANARGDDQDERFGMSQEAYERFVQEAERWGVTPQRLKEMIDENLGQPLLYDRVRKVLLSYQSDARGTPTVIHISPDATGTESVRVQYELAIEGGHSTFMYSAAAQPEQIADVMWRDLNADGVFDLLLIVTDHNDLLNLDRGAYILVDAQWVPAIREGEKDEHRMRRRDSDQVYEFDFTTGRWVAE